MLYNNSAIDYSVFAEVLVLENRPRVTGGPPLVNITHHLASLRGMAWTRGEQKLPSALFHPQNQPKSKGDTTKPARPNRQAKRSSSSSSSSSAPTEERDRPVHHTLCFSSEPHPSSGNFHHAPALSLVPRCALPIHTTRSRNTLIRRTTSNKLFSSETLKSALCYPILSYPILSYPILSPFLS